VGVLPDHFISDPESVPTAGFASEIVPYGPHEEMRSRKLLDETP
jgi:hypothetical protein